MSDQLSINSVIVAASDQVSCDVGGEAAILSLKNGVYYGLDPIGARVWALIQDPVPVNTVRDVIASEYDVDPETCERDLLVLVGELLEQALIELRSAP
jgi:hypothetical protein